VTPVEIHQGKTPITLGPPHSGTFLPGEMSAALTARSCGFEDTDWHRHRRHDGFLSGASSVRAAFHRPALDTIRDPLGALLYPGPNTTGLVPLTDFDGHDIRTP
jgi:formiminoglutamase